MVAWGVRPFCLLENWGVGCFGFVAPLKPGHTTELDVG